MKPILFLLTAVFILVFSNSSKADVSFSSNNTIVIKEKKPKTTRRTTRTRKARVKRRRMASTRKSTGGFTKWKGHRMPISVANKLKSVENKFGKIRITSSCRPGARIKKNGRPSMHSYCREVDFNPPRGKYRAVANYLKRTWSGGVGTYSGRFNHIHIDNNRGRWHN